jgi:hypothetical protein
MGTENKEDTEPKAEKEKNSKTDKESEKVDKELLSKAKDSRDMIDKKLRTFENTMEVVKKDSEKKKWF